LIAVVENVRLKPMALGQNHFEFTGALFQEQNDVVALCLELDVSSQGRSPKEARKMLAEAVSIYLETCFENGIPHLRPVPKEEDPRLHPTENLLEIFPLRVDFKVSTLA